MGESLNPSMLIDQISHWPQVVTAQLLEVACFPETLEKIQQIIHEQKLNRVIIAACSNRTHESLFQRTVRMAGLNPYLLELINIRDQCSLVHLNQPEMANRKALELTRLALGRLISAQAVHKQAHTCRQSALIIGGGVSGMTAALSIADSGYDVILVERSEFLGGNLQTLYYVAEGYNPRRLGRDLINRVRAHRRITTYLRTELVQHTGHVGHFNSLLLTNHSDGTSETFTVEHGVTIVATGGRESRDHPWLARPKVITQSELEEKIIHNPQEIATLNNVVMIQCALQADGPNYCSRICCTNAMKNAIRLKLFNPGCNVYVLYKNIVTYGFREEYYTEARRLGVVFIRYTDDNPPELVEQNEQLFVRVQDLSLDRWLNIPADLIPLSTAITPNAGARELSDILRVPISSEGFFEEAQIKLRPMDFMREGIFLAGMAHYPKFIEESIAHASAAAARALTLLSQGTLYLGGIVAVVDPDKCVGCLTCTRTCPFSIPQIIQEGNRHGVGGLGGAAFIDPAQCQGCGTCTGECPANAIQLTNYTDTQMMMRDIGGLGRWLPQPQVAFKP